MSLLREDGSLTERAMVTGVRYTAMGSAQISESGHTAVGNASVTKSSVIAVGSES